VELQEEKLIEHIGREGGERDRTKKKDEKRDEMWHGLCHSRFV
jgi:hypothetical protein